MDHINWTLGVILPYINFFTFIVAAFFLFRKPALQAAKKARDVFDKASIEASQEKEEINRKLKDLRKRSEGLAAEIDNIRAVAEASARTEEKSLIEEGERIAQHVRDETTRVIEAEIENLRREMSVEIIDLVKKEVADRIVRDVGNDRQHLIIEESIRSLNSAKLSVS